jgi:hypothetical protein
MWLYKRQQWCLCMALPVTSAPWSKVNNLPMIVAQRACCMHVRRQSTLLKRDNAASSLKSMLSATMQLCVEGRTTLASVRPQILT